MEERRLPKVTSAKDQAAAIKKAQDIVERLRRSVPTELGRAKGAHLVAHYLDPTRRPPRVAQLSVKHREEPIRICQKYVLPVIGEVSCRELPKGRRRRITMFPVTTPGGAALAELVQRRLDELEFGELMFPAAKGGWMRRSNYGRHT